MKHFSLYTVTWLILIFGLVTMANPLVPKSTKLLSTIEIDQQNNYHHLKSRIKKSSLGNHLIVENSNQDLSSKSSTNLSPNEQTNHQKCPEFQNKMMKRPRRLKRSAMLLNKIVSALHKAMDNNKNSRSNRVYLDSYQSSLSSSQQMDLTRRTGSKKMFRKCYFNPVACF